tara:strand:+ start:2540 stop:4471 length:1932 start_codon:yes stop_codon:yes gene_type:complete
MDFVSMAVIGTSGALAYLNSFRDTFTSETPEEAASKTSKTDASIDPAVARSVEFLTIRLQTMLKEGTLTDVKAVLRQIEDAGLQEKVPDYKRAQNIVKSVPNSCGKPQIIRDPTRYQNQPLNDFVHNNFVPFFRGRHTQNMVGTGVASGNWNSLDEGSTVVNMNKVSGNDPFTRPSRSNRDPESRVFGINESVVNNVWGSPLTRPDMDRFQDVTAKRPDLSSTETIKVGPGLNIPGDKNVSDRGFHQMYRPIDDARAVINGKVRTAQENPKTFVPGKFALGKKATGQIPYSGGLRPAKDESFTQDSGDADVVSKYQGSSFVVKKCNESNQKDLELFATRGGPGGHRFTGEYNTEQMLRPETKRGQATPNIDTHYPGLITGEVKRLTNPEGDLQREGFNHNIKNFKTGLDREKSIRTGLPTGAMGNSRITGTNDGPGRYYLNDNYTDNGELPAINVTGTAGVLGAFGPGSRISQSANTTNRELFSQDQIALGARGNSGHLVPTRDAMRKGHRETTNTDTINLGGRLVNQGTENTYSEGQRNNLRSLIDAGDRPNPGRTNELASVKVRVGGYQLNDIRAMADVADRPNVSMATNPEIKIGKTNTNYNKLVESYADPRTGMKLIGGYGNKPEDSRTNCKNGVMDGV